MADTDFQSFIEDVLARNDIVDIISEYTTLKRTGNNMMGLCPLHNDKKSPSLSVSPDKQIFHCFGCGAGGNAINFIESAMNLDFMDSLKYLADRAHLEMPERNGSRDKQKQLALSAKRQRIYEVNAASARYFYECLADGENPGIQYLRDRKITNKTIRKFGIGYAPDGWSNLINYLRQNGYTESEMFEAGVVKRRDDGTYYDAFFDGRIIFPIIDVRGNVIAFGGRIIRSGTDAPKYWNTPETLVFKKKDNLFGLNIAKDFKSDKLLLMEGYMDVVSLHQNGFGNAVASLGTAFTPEQAKLVKRYASRAVLCYDNDEAGKKATLRAGDILYDAGVKVRVLTVTDGKDPDEFIKIKGAEMFALLIENSKPLIEYKIDEARQKYSSDDIDEQADFIEEVSGILAKIKNEAQRELYIVRVADSLKISPDGLRSGVDDIALKTAQTEYRREQNRVKRNTARTAFRQDKVSRSREQQYNTEKLLLSLMTDKKTVKTVKEAGITADDFTANEIHKKLAKFIFEAFENGKTAGHTELINMFEPEEAGRVSEILINDKSTKDKSAEAAKLAKTMLLSRVRRLTEQAIASGDDDELKKLYELKEKLKN